MYGTPFLWYADKQIVSMNGDFLHQKGLAEAMIIQNIDKGKPFDWGKKACHATSTVQNVHGCDPVLIVTSEHTRSAGPKGRFSTGYMIQLFIT